MELPQKYQQILESIKMCKQNNQKFNNSGEKSENSQQVQVPTNQNVPKSTKRTKQK